MFVELSDREVEMLINAVRDKMTEALDHSLAAEDFTRKREWYGEYEQYRAIQEKLMG